MTINQKEKQPTRALLTLNMKARLKRGNAKRLAQRQRRIKTGVTNIKWSPLNKYIYIYIKYVDIIYNK